MPIIVVPIDKPWRGVHLHIAEKYRPRLASPSAIVPAKDTSLENSACRTSRVDRGAHAEPLGRLHDRQAGLLPVLLEHPRERRHHRTIPAVNTGYCPRSRVSGYSRLGPEGGPSSLRNKDDGGHPEPAFVFPGARTSSGALDPERAGSCADAHGPIGSPGCEAGPGQSVWQVAASTRLDEREKKTARILLVLAYAGLAAPLIFLLAGVRVPIPLMLLAFVPFIAWVSYSRRVIRAHLHDAPTRPDDASSS